jgi:5'-methylthioadenosine phosphorylase
VHIDFTEPYDAALRARIVAAARLQGEAVEDGAVYGAAQGPRLETAAEVGRMERDGVDIVGMTGMPEAALAREARLAYAAICPVANDAAGRGGSAHGVRFDSIEAVLHEAMGRVRRIIDGLCLLDD